MINAGAILLAAGRGRRLGASEPKAFVRFGGRSMFLCSLETLLSEPAIRELVLVVPPGYEERARRIVERHLGNPRRARILSIIRGGRRRQDSVLRGIEALSPDLKVILVHDAARPLVSLATVRTVLRDTVRSGACICAAAATDTLKRIRGSRIVETPDRRQFRHAQTPQAFRAGILREAYRRAVRHGWEGTDCSSLVERAGFPVRVVPPVGPNPKVTTPEDRVAAEALWRRRRR